jgi:hypothetical protein
MIQAISDYFGAEKHESLLFIAVGVVACGVAVWLWSQGHRLKTMAFPLVAVALIQVVVGGSVYFRTDSQVAQLQHKLSASPAELKTIETARMEQVMQRFQTYKRIEIALILLGICLMIFLRRSDIAVGIGSGLMIQAAFMLCLDLFAETRGEDYLKALTQLAA